MTNRSKCCNATVRVGGEGETHYYICNQCEKVCDVTSESRKTLLSLAMLGTAFEKQVGRK